MSGERGRWTSGSVAGGGDQSSEGRKPENRFENAVVADVF